MNQDCFKFTGFNSETHDTYENAKSKNEVYCSPKHIDSFYDRDLFFDLVMILDIVSENSNQNMTYGTLNSEGVFVSMKEIHEYLLKDEGNEPTDILSP